MNQYRKPQWIKKLIFNRTKENSVKHIINKTNLHTVCKESRCPNIGECFSNKTAAFLLLGDTCTRNCRFCNIKKGSGNLAIDYGEPLRILDAVKKLDLKYVVLTSVTRDDLEDGGAGVFRKTVKAIKKFNNDINVEVLIPDFDGNYKNIDMVINCGISVLSHNLETVKRLYPEIRAKSDYYRSLEILRYAKERTAGTVLIKSGIMVGLGETIEEVEELMLDFCDSGGEALTIGQYLSPGKEFYPVKEFIKPGFYEIYRTTAKKIGIKYVFAEPYVRSSYFAEKFFLKKI